MMAVVVLPTNIHSEGTPAEIEEALRFISDELRSSRSRLKDEL
jgi:hypothetical protein